MNQTTNYILLFSLLVYLKLVDKNKDTIKILVSLVILYFVYQLFKKDKVIENFPSPCTEGSSITDACLGVTGTDSDNGSCDSPDKVLCSCDNTTGWAQIVDNSSSPSPSPSKIGKCYCDPVTYPTDPNDPNNPNGPAKIGCETLSSLGSTCQDWASIPGCPDGTQLIPGTHGDAMTSSPNQHCCSSASPPDPCGPNPCLNGGSCTAVRGGGHTCNCINGYTGNNCGSPPPAVSTTPCSSPIEDYWFDDAGIVQQSPLDPGQTQSFQCNERNGNWYDRISWWKREPGNVEYMCPTGGGTSIVFKKDPKDRTPCSQLWWWWLPLWVGIAVVIIILYHLARRPGSWFSRTFGTQPGLRRHPTDADKFDFDSLPEIYRPAAFVGQGLGEEFIR